MPSFVRLVTERATRSWVFRRRLPSSFGNAPLVVTPAAGLKYLFRSMQQVDPALLRNAAELVRKGDVVWDIGANVGLFTFAAASLAGKNGQVVAFEPDAWLVYLLTRSRALQSPSSASVAIIPAAIASEIGLRQFQIATRSRAASSLAGYGLSQTGGTREVLTVSVFNLDWLLNELPAPNIIKCDVEGAEVEVFKDQRKILREVRPVIVCEVAERNVTEMTSILRDNKYSVYDGEASLVPGVELEQVRWSTVAIPEELRLKYLN